MESVDNSVEWMNNNVDWFALIHKEKTTHIVITTISAKIVSIYDLFQFVWPWDLRLPIHIFISMRIAQLNKVQIINWKRRVYKYYGNGAQLTTELGPLQKLPYIE